MSLLSPLCYALTPNQQEIDKATWVCMNHARWDDAQQRVVMFRTSEETGRDFAAFLAQYRVHFIATDPIEPTDEEVSIGLGYAQVHSLPDERGTMRLWEPVEIVIADFAQMLADWRERYGSN